MKARDLRVAGTLVPLRTRAGAVKKKDVPVAKIGAAESESRLAVRGAPDRPSENVRSRSCPVSGRLR